MTRLLAEEAGLQMSDLVYYLSFAARVKELRQTLQAPVRRIPSKGLRLVGYGVAAKGATLLNYMKFENEDVEYVVDRNPVKVGNYLAGVPVETFTVDRPDYVLVLAWNFTDEIIQQNQEYVAWMANSSCWWPKDRASGRPEIWRH